VSAGVRNLDGMPDGHSGSARQCPRQHRFRSRRAAGLAMPARHRPCSPHVEAAVACGNSGPGHRVRLRAARVAMAAVLPQGPPCVRAGGRRPVVGRTSVRGVRPPQTPAWPRVPDTSRPDGGRSGSGGRSIRRPVRLVTTSSTLLRFLKAGPAGARLRRPSSRRQRYDGHRGSGLALPHRGEPKQSRARWLHHPAGPVHQRAPVKHGHVPTATLSQTLL
jgi:hypothetical protein